MAVARRNGRTLAAIVLNSPDPGKQAAKMLETGFKRSAVERFRAMLGPMEAQQTPGGGQPPAPGWYPDPSQPGAQRWWDGDSVDPADPGPAGRAASPVAAGALRGRPRTLASWRCSPTCRRILTGFIGPLIFYLVKKDEDPFVADQSREALNFNLSILIYSIGLGVVLG